MLNYKELSPSLVATLTLGLPDTSRVKLKLSGQKIGIDRALRALIFDAISTWLWMNQKKGTPRPKSVYKYLTEDHNDQEELEAFDTTEEFDTWYKSKHVRNNDV